VVCPGLIDTPILQSTKYVKFDPEALLQTVPEKPMDPRRAARLILRGVDRNHFLIIMTVTAHALWRFHRYAPNTSIRLGKIAIKKFRSVRREDD
jgi:short-subunit dehydrogenase